MPERVCSINSPSLLCLPIKSKGESFLRYDLKQHYLKVCTIKKPNNSFYLASPNQILIIPEHF